MTRYCRSGNPTRLACVLALSILGSTQRLAGEPQRQATPQLEPCGAASIHVPRGPDIVQVDLSLLKSPAPERDSNDECVSCVAEWSRIEKLRSLYEKEAEKGPCRPSPLRSNYDLYVSLPSIKAGAGKDTQFQFFGLQQNRVQEEGSEQTVSAYPVAGPVAVDHVVSDQDLQIALLDLRQLDFVQVPRIQILGENCFQIFGVVAVPARLFEQAADPDRNSGPISLRGLRKAMERMTNESGWYQVIAAEEPACNQRGIAGYTGQQLQSFDFDVQSHFAGVDFTQRTIDFWKSLETALDRLKKDDIERIGKWAEQLGAQPSRN